MAEFLRLHEVDTEDAVDGDVVTFDQSLGRYHPKAPAPAGVQSIVEGSNVKVDATDSLHPKVSAVLLEPLTTEVWNGTTWEPALVWDDDNQLVMTRVV